jgi:hypothetical protein
MRRVQTQEHCVGSVQHRIIRCSNRESGREKQVLQTHHTVEVIPAASRLVSSLRDMGYEFTTAIADLVDNSIEAGATTISVDIEFEGAHSWVRLVDNGCGMTPAALREAMRYGSSRIYSDNDLGKFGLGLKVASLSQCRRLSVASRTNPGRADISAYCWDLEHIERANRWELLPVSRELDGAKLYGPLREQNGTVVLWQRLDRILGYQDPDGESARRRLAVMTREVEGHLSMVFHRLLSGEAPGRRKLNILVNGRSVLAWDPFARDEPGTRKLDAINLPISHGKTRGEVLLEPFVLPHQSAFSSPDSFRRASGPANWNQQQGFYVYRSNRLIQGGGWCRIRTLDEHTKLARVALRFSPQLDDAFRVNVSKMRVELPVAVREQISEAISPVTRLANEAYRRSDGKKAATSAPEGKVSSMTLHRVTQSLLSVSNAQERRIIKRVVARLTEG